MLRTGMVSVTFRRMAPADVVELVARSKLKQIEWSADRHVPHGDVAAAREVAERTRDAGLTVAAYGSYYRVGPERRAPDPFEQILETAVALGAPLIRVWAGERESREAHDSHWNRVFDDTRDIAAKAAAANIDIAFQYHPLSLNDSPRGTVRLMERLELPNLYTLWQVDGRLDYETCMRGLKRVRRWVRNLHVFHWHEGQRRPLEEGAGSWYNILMLMARTPGDHVALLEFVQDDAPQTFLEDAETLRKLVRNVNRALKEEQREK